MMKLDSNSILIDVTVTDSAKKPVTNLPRDEFSIYEDGKLQELTGFYSVETPYSILLLFDRSTSTENQWPLLQTALERFFDALRPQDSVSIATFTGQLNPASRLVEAVKGPASRCFVRCKNRKGYGFLRGNKLVRKQTQESEHEEGCCRSDRWPRQHRYYATLSSGSG